ncbi:asparagine synthase (glutamine-hydrolyzing) [Candidatus Fermentibacteria bacterium]|nr:MAG: asparagine synthase (glutamine-hydrolyzing) [Candidatus Fermentibacteria bacterium]
MCGIAGIISLGSELTETDLSSGRRMTDILRHRGPDSSDHLHDSRCFLGNTRLSIIDLSDQADLPMQNDSGSVWLAYNGEITNFRELSRQFDLAAKYSFRTTSDTEVLLHLYEEMGIECLKHLSGMFAFTLYDRNRQKVYIVRDFYGTRPLFWHRKGDRLYFASEIKSFMEVDGFTPEVNREAIFHYFSLAYIPGTGTAFKNVHEMDGSHMLEIDLNEPQSVEPVEYYRIQFKPDSGMTFREAEEGFYDAILNAVNRNLISDAPVGTTLSGGLDSSSILGLARVLGKGKELHSFSLKVNEKSFDESSYQRIMASYAGSIHHEIEVNPKDVMRCLYRQMAYMDEPIGDGSAIPFMLLSEEASKYVKVLLSGEGGDEISNAYETHMANHLSRFYKRFVPSFLRRFNRAAASRLPVSYSKLSFEFLARRFTAGAELTAPEAHMHYRHVLDKNGKRQLMPWCGSLEPTERIFSDMFYSLDYQSELDKLAHMDMKYFFIGDLMQKNDRMFMANSVEARFPFMDRKAVEFFTTIPSRYKIRGFTRRYVEKKAMRQVLPPAVRKRQNFGIELPYSMWFEDSLTHIGTEWFSPDRTGASGILNPEEVTRLWNNHMNRKQDNGRTLWSILNFLIWFDMFINTGNFRNHM